MHEHLVFYDGECGLCDRVVQTLLKVDTHERFVFAPLQGKTAEKLLQDLPTPYRSLDTMILIENYTTTSCIRVQADAALRILFLLGGFYTIPGLLSFLPPALFNLLYRLVARNRHRLFKPISCVVPESRQQGRFLS